MEDCTYHLICRLSSWSSWLICLMTSRNGGGAHLARNWGLQFHSPQETDPCQQLCELQPRAFPVEPPGKTVHLASAIARWHTLKQRSPPPKPFQDPTNNISGTRSIQICSNFLHCIAELCIDLKHLHLEQLRNIQIYSKYLNLCFLTKGVLE